MTWQNALFKSIQHGINKSGIRLTWTGALLMLTATAQGATQLGVGLTAVSSLNHVANFPSPCTPSGVFNPDLSIDVEKQTTSTGVSGKVNAFTRGLGNGLPFTFSVSGTMTVYALAPAGTMVHLTGKRSGSVAATSSGAGVSASATGGASISQASAPVSFDVPISQDFTTTAGITCGGQTYSVVTTFDLSIVVTVNNNCPGTTCGTATATNVVDVSATTLSAPTNLRTIQIGNSGTQIQLTWDYGSDPIDGFVIDRQTPAQHNNGTWETLSTRPTTTVRSFVDSVSPFNAYNYRIRAYSGADESANSNEAVCFQILLYTEFNGYQMAASFQPDPVSLAATAAAFGYDHFNWIQYMTYAPPDALLYTWNNVLLPPSPPQILDPPSAPCSPTTGESGWSYLRADCGLPYYWNEVNGSWPSRYNLSFGGQPAPFIPPNSTPTAILFHDFSTVRNSLAEHNEFHTILVGVKDPVGLLGTGSVALAAFNWSTNAMTFWGLPASGGILDYYRTYNVEAPMGPVSGGVLGAQIEGINDLPLSVRTALSQAGVQGMSFTPKIDKDAPTTAAFLSGRQSANGWYTGPVTIALIATDIDGPMDIASTSYRLDGGTPVTYSSPFTVTGDGTHSLVFGSVDRALNAESPLPTKSFGIDSTLPRIQCSASPSSLWPPNGKPVAVTVSGTFADGTSGIDPSALKYSVLDEYNQVHPSGSIAIGTAGAYSFPLSVIADRDGNDKDGRKYIITVSGKDRAGNTGTCSTTVTVLHDQGR